MDIFFRIILPATLPFVITAVRLGLSAGLTTLLAAESTGAQGGLGMRIRSLQTPLKPARCWPTSLSSASLDFC